jgi:hypothetical protein
MEITPEIAQRLLNESELAGDTRYAVHGGKAYCARQHRPDIWHGYPVGWHRVPEPLRRKWIDEDRVRRREIRMHWD